MESTKSAIISSYPTSMKGIHCFINYKETLDKNISNFNFLPTCVFSYFGGKFSIKKLPASIFGQTTGYIGFIAWVESQSDYQKFNIQSLVFNRVSYIYFTKTVQQAKYLPSSTNGTINYPFQLWPIWTSVYNFSLYYPQKWKTSTCKLICPTKYILEKMVYIKLSTPPPSHICLIHHPLHPTPLQRTFTFKKIVTQSYFMTGVLCNGQT